MIPGFDDDVADLPPEPWDDLVDENAPVLGRIVVECEAPKEWIAVFEPHGHDARFDIADGPSRREAMRAATEWSEAQQWVLASDGTLSARGQPYFYMLQHRSSGVHHLPDWTGDAVCAPMTRVRNVERVDQDFDLIYGQRCPFCWEASVVFIRTLERDIIFGAVDQEPEWMRQYPKITGTLIDKARARTHDELADWAVAQLDVMVRDHWSWPTEFPNLLYWVAGEADYDHGVELGCPQCQARRRHVCAFLFAEWYDATREERWAGWNVPILPQVQRRHGVLSAEVVTLHG